ncbi:DUF2442 domain-containing protein [bacterium]|nr:DUF2442 domain-containing protein [bacterium]
MALIEGKIETMTEFIKIKMIRPLSGSVLLVTFSNGENRYVEYGHLIAKGGMWAALADPDYFALAQIDEYERGVFWPNGADSCADAMFERGTLAQPIAS